MFEFPVVNLPCVLMFPPCPNLVVPARLLGAMLLCLVPGLSRAHGTHGQLMEVVNKKIESAPEDANLWYQRGFLNLEHDDPKQALADLEKAESLAPGKLPTLLLKGQALALAGNLEEAKLSLDAHILRFPEHGLGYISRARVLPKLGMREEALADYRTALSKTPNAEPDLVQEAAVSAATNGHDDEAIKMLDTGLKRLGEIPSLLMKALEIETKAGHYDSALSRVEAMQKSAPRPEPWMAKRAELLAQAGRHDESRTAWNALIVHLESLPNLERGSNSMSLLAEQARKAMATMDRPDRRTISVKPDTLHEEEIQLMNQHLNVTATDASIWHQRALLLLADGEYEQALLDCEEVDRLAPGGFPTGYIRCQILVARGNLEKGRTALDEFLETHPDHVSGLLTRARLQLRARRIEAALGDFREAIRCSGAKPATDLVQETVNVLVANGRSGEAIETLEAQIFSQGNIPELLNRLLELEIAEGKLDSAIFRVDEFAGNSPQPEQWIAKRAELLTQAGRTAEARTAWLSLLSHLTSLPNLQRGQPAMAALAQQAKIAISTSQSPIPAQ